MLTDHVQTADWKSEKHVPVIDAPDSVAAGEAFGVTVSVGKEIAHPNTTEHHIAWIALFFQPEGDKFAYDLGRYAFNAHGASAKGANEGPAYADPTATVHVKVDGPGKLYAMSYCNIHGLWQGEKAVAVS